MSTFNLAYEVRATVAGRKLGIGDYSAPITVTLSSGLTWMSRDYCALSTRKNIAAVSGAPEGFPTSATFMVFIPSVDGNFGFIGTTVADNSSLLGWPAGVPLILSTGKTNAYGVTTGTRAANASQNITNAYFYATSTAGYVDCFLGK